MRRGVGAYEASLFEFARAVTPDDPCFLPDVYRIARGGALFDWDEMTGLFNSFRPILASVPGVHGNASFLNYVEYQHRERAPDRVECIRVSLTEEHSTSPPALGAYLASVLHCQKEGGSLARLLKASRRILSARDNRRTALVLLNASRCTAPASSEWLGEGVVELDANHRDLLETFDIHFVVVGSYDLFLHGFVAAASDPLCAVTIEPYSQEQVVALVAPSANPADAPGSFSFEPEAADALYQHTAGDKYFTNLLAAAAVTAARGNTSPDEPVRVGEAAINWTAGFLAQGLLVEDRVTRPFREAFDRKPAVAEAIAELAGAGPKAWHGIPKDIRRLLFQSGVVSPAPVPLEGVRPGPAATRDMFLIRNPLMRTFAESLLYREATRQAAGPAESAAPSAPVPETTVVPPSDKAAHQVPHSFEMFQVGDTLYRLRQATQGVFFSETSTFCVPVVDIITGRGETLESALADWQTQFHIRFQRLFTKLESERTPDDKELLDQFQTLIDLEEHRKTVPVIVRQIGAVERIQPLPAIVRWEDGSREEAAVDILPPEFLTYSLGQRFEALVARDPESHRIWRIIFSQRLAPLPNLTPEEVDQLWNSLPTTRSLPAADWE
jgi:hypothetical protein